MSVQVQVLQGNICLAPRVLHFVALLFFLSLPPVSLVSGVFGGVVRVNLFMSVREVCQKHNLALDWMSLVFYLWNFGSMGIIVIYWKGPLRLQQAYLIVVCAVVVSHHGNHITVQTIIYVNLLLGNTSFTLSARLDNMVAAFCHFYLG